MNIPLSTRINAKAKHILNELHRKTHIPICDLTEKAIFLLKERYDRMEQAHKPDVTNERFMELLDYSMKKHDATYRKLAD